MSVTVGGMPAGGHHSDPAFTQATSMALALHFGRRVMNFNLTSGDLNLVRKSREATRTFRFKVQVPFLRLARVHTRPGASRDYHCQW